nr:Gag-Pol polyprotein [Tanacetum cinerariifolium]
NDVSNDFSKPVTAQTLPTKKKSCLQNTNVLAPGIYKLHTDHTQARTSKLPQDSKKTNKRVSFSTGVISTTSVSRPQLKSNPMGNRVLHSNSRGKKLEVEEHCRNVKLPKNKMSVTACNDSLNAKTLNVKFVSAMCAKCMMIDKHDLCALKSVAKPLKKTVASESNKKPRTNVRKLNDHFGKIYKWSYIKFTPSGYMWKPKSPKVNVNPNFLEIVLFIVDSGCSKHMTGNLKLLINFVEKFLGTVKFGNDQIAPILGYEDLVQGASRAYRVFNKRTKVIMESIHVNFDELPQMASDQISSDPAPECQTMALEHVVSKSFDVSAADAPNQQPHAKNDQVADDEFINIFSTLPSEHRWTKDHPLEQVIGNPSQSVRTRRQLESDAEMCMFALTVSRTEPKNIKEAMADSDWIESMQEELHQFDRLE